MGSRVDVHAHAIPTPYKQALDAAGITSDSGATIPTWSPDSALTFMDDYGIACQVISISEPGVSFLGTAAARATLAREVNDFLVEELVATTDARRRGRFGTFALLPLYDLSPAEVDAACIEAERALGSLSCDGIAMFSNYGGVYLGDPRLDPLYSVLDRLGAVVFIHSAKPHAAPASSLPLFLCEFPFETTRGVASLGRAKVFTRFPRIRWVLAHAGGTLPYLIHRINAMARFGGSPTDAFDPGIPQDRLYYDTALSPAPASIDAVRSVAPLSHLLFGTDWPFSGQIFVVPGDPAPQLNESLTATERGAVDRGNALALLPGVAERIATAPTGVGTLL